ncbi:MAG: hypothetical protein H0X27_13940, partial [Caulobacteraceae bacterium]|nr:hypothetical protein [Caulobacteraceae bacterium]
MTTKTISTYIPAGYILSSSYDDLKITRTGGVGGFGVFSDHYAVISNFGTINETTALVSSYVGLSLAAGGVVFNQKTGFIGGDDGVDFYGSSPGYVTNLGTIEATSRAVYMHGGGRVTNGSYANRNALIEGHVVEFDNLAGTVVNYGTIAARVSMFSGGAVTNGGAGDTTASIIGGYGVGINGASSTVANFGTIQAYAVQGFFGVALGAGGSVVNGGPTDSVARIEGATGVRIYGAAAVTNFGAIVGTGAGAGAYGVALRNGGRLTNGAATATGALVEGYTGVIVSGAAGTIANYGTIKGQGIPSYQSGVVLFAGGSVVNGGGADRSALISGARGLASYGAATVKNFGTIRGVGAYSGDGVDLFAGGVFTNGSLNNGAALVEGVTGLVLSGAATATNFGAISGLGDEGGDGVRLGGGESLTNGAAGHAGALIEGFNGVTVTGAATTVTNFGVIRGAAGTAVSFASSTDVLVVESGCAFKGAVLGAGGTLDLDTGVGTLSGLLAGGNVTVSGSMAATTFSNFATVQIGASATFATSGAVTIAADQTLIDAGALTLGGGKKASVTNAGLIETTGSGVLTIQTALDNSGTLKSLGGDLIVQGAVTGSGKAMINGGTIDFASTFSQNVSFNGAAGTLELAQSQTYKATVSGFSKTGGTFLDLDDIAFGKATTASYSGNKSSGVLTVTDGTHTAQINLKGDYRTSTFVVADDGHGGTLVHDPVRLAANAPPADQRFIAAMAGLGGGGAGLEA